VSTQPPIQIARRAEVALERLQPQDRRRIASALEKLAAGGMASKDISKLGAGAKGEIYLIRAGRDLRIIIKRTEDAVEVLDIVRHDKLRQVYDTFRRGGGAV
jgi:hypothetical protein